MPSDAAGAIRAYEADVRVDADALAASRARRVQRDIVQGASAVTVETDRFDLVLLLDRLPARASQQPGAGGTTEEIGWEDLDLEATRADFALTEEQAAERRREHLRSKLAKAHEERIAAIDRQEAQERPSDAPRSSPVATDGKGMTDDDEPHGEQLELMKRTAAAVLASANPSALEMRILANHGADPRFAFLRSGNQARWQRAWRQLLQSDVGAQAKQPSSLLAGYDSDGSEEEQSREAEEQARKSKRLAKAKEWAAVKRLRASES